MDWETRAQMAAVGGVKRWTGPLRFEVAVNAFCTAIGTSSVMSVVRV
jgi:hypothetical protein